MMEGGISLALSDSVRCRFESAVSWSSSDGAVHSCPAGETREGVMLERAVEQTAQGAVIRLTVTNRSAEPVRILSMDSLRVARREDLDLGVPWASIQAYCQGRHKNDIPAVVTLGAQDDNLRDAAGGMGESGVRRRDEGPGRALESDTMTLLRGRESLLIAFPDGTRCFCRTRLRLDGQAPALTAGCEPGVELAPGESLAAEAVCLRAGGDWRALIEGFAREKAVRFGVPARRLAPAVFCTWYYYGLTVTLQDVEENLSQIQARRIPYDVFQIDEGWEVTLGEWRPNAKFPIAMKALADQIRAAHMVPGLWTSPFIAHETASVWREHPDWKLRDRQGRPVLFPMNDTVYHVLDITIPAVIDWVRALYRTLTRDWGYRYHKLDFTRAAILYEDAPRHDMSLPLPAAYRRAMQAVREGIGPDSYLLVCGGLYDAAIGIADAQRTGSDVLSMWTSDVQGGGKTVPFTVKQNLLRWYMSRWWHNDADCLMLRRQAVMTRGLRLTYGLLNDSELRTMLVNQYLSGGLLSQTEPLSQIDDDRLWQLRHLLPLIPLECAPALFDGARFPSTILVRGLSGAMRELVLINWRDDAPWTPVIRPDRVARDWPRQGEPPAEAERYLAVCFYGGVYDIAAVGEAVTLPPIPPHGAEVVRVHAYDAAKPYLVGSTAHFSLGEEVALSFEGGALTFSVDYRFPVPSDYRVLLPEGWDDGRGSRTAAIRVEKPGRFSFTLTCRPAPPISEI